MILIGVKVAWYHFGNQYKLYFKKILVKVPFWAKTMVPYESRKREKIHISYIIHPRTISLTESRGSKSFFILKSGVHFSFWAHLNFAYLLRPTLSEFYRKGHCCKILIFNFFQPLLGLVSSPHSLFNVHSSQSQFYFHPAVLHFLTYRDSTSHFL